MLNLDAEKKFLKFYDENVANLYRYIYFRVGSKESTQDLTSECFFKYLRSNSQIKNPRAFLYQIARNLIVDFYRQSAKKPLSLEEITAKGPDFNDSRVDLHEQAQRAGDIEAIKKSLGSLKEEYQEVIILRYIDELEINEIVEILGKKQGAVRTLISRALKALRGILKENPKA